MSTRLIQVVAFANVAPAGTATQAHSININGIAQKPDFVAADAGEFSVSVTLNTVTVTNNGSAPVSGNVWLELKHSIPRQLGKASTGLTSPGLLPRPFIVASGGGGGGGASSLLSIYGDGDWGSYTATADERWDAAAIPPVPGVPPPAGENPAYYPFWFFDDLTINPGVTISLGGDSNAPPEHYAPIIFVKGTLTIGAGARISADGSPGFDQTGGAGGRSPSNSNDGGKGGDARSDEEPEPGLSANNCPAVVSVTMIGGNGGNGTGYNGADGGKPSSVSWPYSLSHIQQAATNSTGIGGGPGGGAGGASAEYEYGGAGGGGGGVVVILARKIVAPAGSITARGGNGESPVDIDCGGGGGGAGGVVIVVTEETSISGIASVAGGTGGTGTGAGVNGQTGGAGEAIALNPMLQMRIPA